MRLISLAIMFAALAGCATGYERDIAASQTLLPGMLGLPLIEGSHIPGECSTIEQATELGADRARTVCVAFPRESEVDWRSVYIRALHQSGWRFTGGAGPVFWFERPINGRECSQRLDMLGWLLGDPAEMAKMGTDEEPNIDWSRIPHGLFMFTVANEPVCGSSRQAP